MAICFVEYRIEATAEANYRAFMQQKLSEYESLQLYEGTDQPLLFVEMWQAANVEEAERIKKERCDERSQWKQVADWIVGGAAKCHAWTFKPVNDMGTRI